MYADKSLRADSGLSQAPGLLSTLWGQVHQGGHPVGTLSPSPFSSPLASQQPPSRVRKRIMDQGEGELPTLS